MTKYLLYMAPIVLIGLVATENSRRYGCLERWHRS